METSQIDRPRRGRVLAGALVALGLSLAAATYSRQVAAAEAASECSPSGPGGSVFVTSDCMDSLYAEPVIDAETDETTPSAHRRIAGHFEGTGITFNIYLPPADAWQGRFFQYTYPLTDARADERALAFAFASGGYAVQAGNSTVSLGYRHAAAAAKFARIVAAQYYGSPDRRIYGYLYGPSGGSFQTVGAAENTSGVWDGFVPIVQGVPMSAPYTFFIRAQARLVLEDKADKIADAVRPGGSGRPFAGLDAAERAMLRELTSFGVPLRAWEDPDYLLGTSAADGLLGFGDVIRSVDPSYVDDFWSKPGYLGTEQSPLGEVVRRALQRMGDTVDNRWNIALRSYYRHQVPARADGYYGFDALRTPDGEARYPQRAFVIGPAATGATSGGAQYDGHVNGKVIVVDNLYDVDALPWHADWYAGRVRTALGDAGFDDRFRLYFNDHADHHEAPVQGLRATYLVSYMGLVEQALRDVADWAEGRGAAPASTTYAVRDAQVVLADGAAQRRGIQPVVRLREPRSGSIRAAAGSVVQLEGIAQTPPGTGSIVAAEWDFDGDGHYEALPMGRTGSTVRLSARHRFDTPGTYFVAVRVTAQRGGLPSPVAKVENLDRVRVVVE